MEKTLNTIQIVAFRRGGERALLEPVQHSDSALLSRTERTLELAHRWGYAPTIEALSRDLLGGTENPIDLKAVVESSSRIWTQDGFVCLRGQESLIEKSRPRVMTNGSTNDGATAIALEFAGNLVRTCPLVECVALSGSAATGGYIPTDDVDLDIFVRNDAKYLTYALCLALGLLVSLRSRTGRRLRKIICINVIWTRAQSKPFVRNDEALAFELLHCRPIFGAHHFREVIAANRWITRHFPQIAAPWPYASPPEPNPLGRIVAWIAAHPKLLVAVDRIGRIASFAAYTLAHRLRSRDPAAMERLAFLKQVKYPYEVFQD